MHTRSLKEFPTNDFNVYISPRSIKQSVLRFRKWQRMCTNVHIFIACADSLVSQAVINNTAKNGTLVHDCQLNDSQLK